jgi:carbamoyltransferase
LRLEDIDVVATHGKAPPHPSRDPFEEKDRIIRGADLDEATRDRQLRSLWARFEHETEVLGVRTPGYLKQLAQLGRPLRVYEHHKAHAASAYYGSGWDKALVLTADGWGEDGSSTLWSAADGEMTLLGRSHTFDSLGYFYGSITKSLGFIPHRHEGKVLGLAAYCDAPRSFGTIRRMIDYDASARGFRGRMENGIYLPRFENPALTRLSSEFPREDIAASAQIALEEVVTALVKDQGSRAAKLCVAGGIFANVKLNQRLGELNNVEEIFVFPNMGDGGLSVGAAWLAHRELSSRNPGRFGSPYLGPAPIRREVEDALASSGLRYRREQNVHAAIAELLASGHVVARFHGAMEYGPRALGHRSILYHAQDPSVNQWLNERLHRSEFMPFAPVTLAFEAGRFYRDVHKAPTPAKYMAITFDCTEEMKAQSPAAVHIDGTARPQLVSPDDNPDLHDILVAYRGKTGLCSLINTSFNMHEEPIVCSVDDAVRAFRAGGLSHLAIGDFIVEGEDAVTPIR